jgi:DNA-binding SARP family transcriptional activator
VELGHFWEKHGLWDNAILSYRKGIEIDDLVETFYQRLMICLIKTGRKPEAIAVYRQCRRLLSVALGLEPMDETREIYQSILSNYRTAV